MINMLDSIRRIQGSTSLINSELSEETVGSVSNRSSCHKSERIEALELYKKLLNFSEVEKQTGIKRSRIMTWVNLYNKRAELSGGKIKALPKQVKKIAAKERQSTLLKLVAHTSMTANQIAKTTGFHVASVRADVNILLVEGKIRIASEIKKTRSVIAV